MDKKNKIPINLTAGDLHSNELTPDRLELLQGYVNPNEIQLTEEEEREKVGELLRVIRMRKGLSQRDVAKGLGYSSPNFVHMIERGRSKAPLTKIDNFSSAYESDVKLSSALLRCTYPDVWRVLLKQMYDLAGVDPGTIDQGIRIWIDEELGK